MIVMTQASKGSAGFMECAARKRTFASGGFDAYAGALLVPFECVMDVFCCADERPLSANP